MFEKIALFLFYGTIAVFAIAIGSALLKSAPFLWIYVLLFVGAIAWGVGSALFGDSLKNGAAARKSVQHQDTRTGSSEDILKELSGVTKGQTVRFGAYDWKVLAKEGDKALLITENVVAKKEFHHDSQARGAIWEKCTLRRWLNGGFLSRTFSPAERELILDTELPNMERSYDGKVTALAPTTDKVFPLSVEELKKYLPDKEEWAAQLAGEYCNWWLRDTRRSDAFAVECFLRKYNTPSTVRNTSSCVDSGIRPAMWVRIR